MDTPTDTTKGTVTTETVKVEQLPKPFWQGIIDDIHTNGSGLVIFACIAVGIIWPEYKEKCSALSTAASIYLFGASKNKNN